MEYQESIVEKKGKVGIISLNRPKVLNALSLTLMDEIINALKELDTDPDVNVIMLKGEGRAFCTGADPADFLGKSRTEMAKVFAKPAEVFEAIHSTSKPVIAAVQGYALAVGCGLAGACDLTVTSEETKYQTPGARFGMVCGTPMAEIYQSVGRKKCLELLLTADMVDAHEAERMGLVNKVVPLEKLDETAMELAEKIASRAPLAIRSSKQLFYQLSGVAHAKTGQLIGDIMAMNADTEDAKDGVAALVERREHKPFKGR